MKTIVYTVIMSFVLVSCHKRSDLEYALVLAGNNRLELEKVLNYYSKNPADSLKLRAAKFLISNMPWHYSYGGEYYDDYIRKVDSMHHDLPFELRLALYVIPEEYPALAQKLEKRPDVEYITADYLIYNIEHSFRTWENSYWLRNLSFTNFCEYLLPYRVSREPLLFWKDSLRDNYKYTIKDVITHVQDVKNDTYELYKFLEKHIREIEPEYMWLEVDVPDPEIGKYTFTCHRSSIAYTHLWRMCGIPTALERLPRWANENNAHDDISIIHDKSPTGIMPKDIHFKTAKIYRNTFSVNRSQIMHTSRDYIPITSKHPFYKDVTEQYIRTADITIKPNISDYDPEYLYLGVFNLGWEAIAHAKIKGGKARFENVGIGCVFTSFYYKGNQQVFCSNPFYVDAIGNMHYLNPDFESLRPVTLDRKYHTLPYKVWWGQTFIAARFESSDTPDFNQPNLLATVDENYYWRIRNIPVDTSVQSRYYRILNRGWAAEMAEIHFYDANDNEIKGKFIGDAETMANPDLPNIQDDDLLTFASFRYWVGVDFGKPVAVSRIEYVPRNDKNGIYPGMNYELLYFDTNRWVSMGKQKATGYDITFENVPDKALLWLRNLTEGREERIFTYENGIQNWH